MQNLDNRRDLIIGGDKQNTIKRCIRHFIKSANTAIQAYGAFHVALSGGSTPKAIFLGLTSEPFCNQINWKKVHLYWSDERSVKPDHPDSNFHMSMESGFKKVPIPKNQIFRMKGEKNIKTHALEYEKILQDHVPDGSFDLLMLGMGNDGHTASLFPETHALHSDGRKVVANFVPKLNTWRMTLTYQCINQAKQIVIYVLGSSKAEMLRRIVSEPYTPDLLPIQGVGTASHKALIIADKDSAALLDTC